MNAGSSPTAADRLQRCRSLYGEGRYDGCAAEVAAHLATQPDDPAALRLFGLCRVRLGDAPAGVALLQRAADLAPGEPEVMLALGIGLLAAGRAEAAAALFRNTCALLPADPAPPLNLASALLTLGDAAGAYRAARKAILRAPRLAEAHYTHGLALSAAGYLREATWAFERATGLAPRFAAAWLSLGVALYRLFDMAGARAAMARVLAIEPDHPGATANLACFDRLTGEYDGSVRRLRALLDRNPDCMEARLALADGILGLEGGAAARAVLGETPPANPAQALHWHLQTILALLLEERFAEARARLETIRAVPGAALPRLLYRRLMLAYGDGDQTAAVELATQMAAALHAERDVLPDDRIASWYDLGRFWQRVGEPSRAFACWTEGHRELARLQPFDRTAEAAFNTALARHFDATRLQQGPRASNRDPAPIFVVGLPRSGTTLVEQILASHGDVFGAGERMALTESFAALAGAWGTPAAAARAAAADRAALDDEATRYLAQLHALAPGKARIVDKMPGNLRLLGYAALLLPGARVICCERDPRDVGLSIYQRRFFGFHAYAHDLRDLGWHIAAQTALAAHWARVLPIPCMTVRLEDWVQDFDATLARLLAFCGLPYDPACERFFETERDVRTASRRQVREPVHDRGIGRWRSFASELAPMIAELQAAGVALHDG